MQEVYEKLKSYQISYQKVEHEAVFTTQQAQKIKKQIRGTGCKNLFLKDKKQYYLVILNDEHQISLKEIQTQIGSKRLSFGSEEELHNVLNLQKGSVTPFGILNNQNYPCIIVIEEALKGKTLLFHPNINTATISITYEDFMKFLDYQKQEYQIIK